MSRIHRKSILLISIIIVLDQLSKYLLYDLELLSHRPIIKPYFNTGVARSMPFSVSLSIAVAILISILAWYNYRIGKISQRVAILLISGSLGNAIDRIILGGVRDFLSIPTFAIINIADIAITTGVILYVYYALFPCKVHPKNYL